MVKVETDVERILGSYGPKESDACMTVKLSMYDKQPYRRCPVCGTRLERHKNYGANYQESGRTYEVHECPNCGSEVWIAPFRRIREEG